MEEKQNLSLTQEEAEHWLRDPSEDPESESIFNQSREAQIVRQIERTPEGVVETRTMITSHVVPDVAVSIHEDQQNVHDEQYDEHHGERVLTSSQLYRDGIQDDEEDREPEHEAYDFSPEALPPPGDQQNVQIDEMQNDFDDDEQEHVHDDVVTHQHPPQHASSTGIYLKAGV